MSLNAEQWRRVDALFPELLALPASGRDAALDRACVDDPALRQELTSLLEAAEDPADFLAAPVAVISTEAPRIETLMPGTRLGPWQLGERIGSGGMGDVYAGERADGSFERRIAIKVIRRGLDTDSVLGRFLRERRILGQLRHPNIAELIDAGATPDGRPYLVMERVDGQPITQWCADRTASLRQILELMCQVCDAVHEAHRQLVVHRDLKPSNVLVSGEGKVKLLDFGVAKMLSDEDNEDTTRTLAAAPLTPACAAPEQFLGQAITTATDVYALGGLLYVLLCGRPPHRRDNLLAALAQLQWEQCPRPSLAVRSPESSLPPEQRRQRARELRGDLDWVLLKALHPAPDRRYRSASELGQDLEHYLQLRPVTARPDSLGYRAQRFLLRNRVPVAAALLALTAIVVALVVALQQARIARTQALRAETEASKAIAVKDFLLGIFRQNSVDHADGAAARDTTAAELLQAGAREIRSSLREVPALRAELLGVLGVLHADLLYVEQAAELYREQLATLRSLGSEPSLAVADLEARLGRLYSDMDRYEDSEYHLQAALRECDRLGAPADQVRAVALTTLGMNAMVLLPAEDLSAERHHLAALDLLRQIDAEPVLQMDVLQSLGTVADYRNDDALAESRFREALALSRSFQARPAVLREQAHASMRLGYFLVVRHRYTEAESLLREALEIYTRQIGADSAWTAYAETELGNLYAAIGRPQEARSDLESALRKLRQVRGADSPQLARESVYALARLAYQAGDLAEADRRYGEATAFERIEPRAELAVLRRDWARVRVARGQFALAQDLLDQAIPVLEADRGPDSPSVYRAYLVQVELLLARGEHRKALDRLVQIGPAPSAPTQVLGAERFQAGVLRAAALLGLGQAEAALSDIADLERELQSLPDAPVMRVHAATLLRWRGEAQWQLGEATAALGSLERALALRESSDVADSPWRSELERLLSQWRRGGAG